MYPNNASGCGKIHVEWIKDDMRSDLCSTGLFRWPVGHPIPRSQIPELQRRNGGTSRTKLQTAATAGLKQEVCGVCFLGGAPGRGRYIVIYLRWELVLKMKLTLFLFRANSQEESNANKVLFLLTVGIVLATKVSTLPPASQGWTSISRSIE